MVHCTILRYQREVVKSFFLKKQKFFNIFPAKKKNVALSRDRLLNEVWGIRYEGGTRTVDVHIAQLRKKTGLNIVSVPKIGYRLEVD